MDSKIILDNLTGREIEELIVNKQVIVEELDVFALEKLLDFETDLLFFGEGNMELIEDCSKRLELLRGDSLKSRKSTVEIIEANEKANIETVAEPKTKGRKRIKLRVLVAAATLAATTVCFFTASADLKFDPYVAALEMANEPTGTLKDFAELETGGNAVTIEVVETSRYSSFEEAKAKEGIGGVFLYPSAFPDGVELRGINFVNGGTQKGTAYFYTTSSSVSFGFKAYEGEIPESVKQRDYYTVNGNKFYLFPERGAYANAFIDGYRYSVMARDYEELVFILDNLKEG